MRMKALIRDSPDDSQTGGDFYEYPVFCQGGFAARTTAATTGSPDRGRGVDCIGKARIRPGNARVAYSARWR
jgi:hypothetical protein